MDMTIGMKTNSRFNDDDPHIAFFGFYDYEAEKAGEVEPFVHMDGCDIQYVPTVFGYRVILHGVYDLTNGKYVTHDDLRNKKLMYVRFEDDYWFYDAKVERVWIDNGNDWSDVINFM